MSEADFIEAYRLHAPGLLQFVKHLRFKDGSQSEDIAQTTWLLAWKNRNQFRGDSSFRSWLFTIAKHVHWGSVRSVPRNVEGHLVSVSLEDMIRPPSVDGRKIIDEISNSSEVAGVLKLISKREASILRMLHMEGLSNFEVAGKLRSTENGVKVLAHRARKRALRRLRSARKRWRLTA